MGDLDADTAVKALCDGRYHGYVCGDWNLWGPVGGYLASIALRAAGAQSVMPRPASFSCHYLAPVRVGDVELTVTRLRRSRRAESLRVVMTQRGTAVLDALVWAVAEGLRGPEQNWSPPVAVPAPEELTVFDPAADVDFDLLARASFWNNVEIRKVFLPGESPEPGGEPLVRSWERYRPRASFGDPWIDACRQLVSVDVAVFPAAAKALARPTFVAPSMDLYVAFHTVPPQDDYYLVEARGSAAGDGLVSGQVRIWSMAGQLAATGTSQLLCRTL